MFERDAWTRTVGFLAAVLTGLLCAGSTRGQSGRPDEESPGAGVLRAHDATLMSSARRAVEDASRRLHDSNCRKVFSDFRDPAGRSLDEILEAKGETAPGYLHGMTFANGSAEATCVSKNNLAGTRPASRVVHLCPQFARVEFADPGYAAALIIHEELHSLGLAENPPASAAITRQVIARCGR